MKDTSDEISKQHTTILSLYNSHNPKKLTKDTSFPNTNYKHHKFTKNAYNSFYYIFLLEPDLNYWSLASPENGIPTKYYKRLKYMII